MLHHQSRRMAVVASRSRLLILSSSTSCVLQKYGQRSWGKQEVNPMLRLSRSLWGKDLVRVQPGSSGLFQSANLGPSVEWRLRGSYAHIARTISTSLCLSSRFMKKLPRQFRRGSKEASAGDESVSGPEELGEFLSSHKSRERRNEEHVNEAVSDQGFDGTFVIGSSPSLKKSVGQRTDLSTHRMNANTPLQRSYPIGDQRPAAQDKAFSKRSSDRFQGMMQVKSKDAHVHRPRVSNRSWKQRDEGMASIRSHRDGVDSTELETVSADLLEMDSRKHHGMRRKSSEDSWRKHPHQETGKSSHFHKKAKDHLMIPRGRDLLYGISPCLLALQHARREVHQLYVTSAFQESQRSEVKEILALAEEKGLSVWTTNRRVLDKFSQHRPHQGVCMETSRLYFSPAPEEEDEDDVPTSSVRLVLDRIKDPMNLGALLRSAYFLGVDKVIVSKKNCCTLTPVVSKASSGVMEIMPVYATVHIPSYLENEKRRGWSIVGASVSSSSPAGDVIPCHQFNHTGPILLVVGNEGFGLSSEIIEQCSNFISIPAGRQLHAGIDSLNVSVATGILLHSLLGRWK